MLEVVDSSQGSTVYRHLDVSALLVGPDGPVAARCAEVFGKLGVRIVRVSTVQVACTTLPGMMPQMVVALLVLTPADRAKLADPTAAVGSLLLELDPMMDGEALEVLLERAAEATIERNLTRDEPVTNRIAPPDTEPPVKGR
jgi:hypothetical protein